MAEPLAKGELGAAAARRAVLERLVRSGSPLAGRVRTVREWAAAAAPPRSAPWSAALPALAALFPTGLPRGELIEISGRRSAGRFGLALSLLAVATGVGENAALVDLGDALDPQQATAAGLDLARLLWARPRDSKQALAAAEALVTGGFPFVVVDLGLPPVPGGRGAEAHWLRLARAAQEAGAMLLVSAPYRACGIAAGIALELDRGRACWSGTGREPRLLEAIENRLEPIKPSRAELVPAAFATFVPLRLSASRAAS